MTVAANRIGQSSAARNALSRGDLSTTRTVATAMVAANANDAEGHFLLGIAASGAGQVQAGID